MNKNSRLVAQLIIASGVFGLLTLLVLASFEKIQDAHDRMR